MGALLLTFCLALLWLLGTTSGRDAILSQIIPQLPDGSTLEWSRIDGVLLGSLNFYDVHYRQPVEHGTFGMSGQHLALDLALLRLLRGQLHLKSLNLNAATLDLPPAQERALTLPEWSELVPEINLPFPLGVDAIAIDDLAIHQNGRVLVEIHHVRGGMLARAGELQIDNLAVTSDRGRVWLDGHYLGNQHGRTHLTARARLPGTPDVRLGLAIRGDLDALDIALSGFAPAQVRAQWSLRGRQWTLNAHSDAFNPGLFAASRAAPIAFTLNANGTGSTAHWQGRVQQGDLSGILHSSTLRRQGQRLDLGEFDLEIDSGTSVQGHLLGSGHADFSVDASPQFALTFRTRNGMLSKTAPVIGVDATLDIGGQFERWQARGDARISRGGRIARAQLKGQGDANGVNLDTLTAQTPNGDLKASGQITWAPALAWEVSGSLDGFDPGYFLRDWPGAVRGHMTSRAHTGTDNTLHLALNLPKISGELRQKPLAGSLHAHAELPTHGTPHAEAALDLRLGNSQIALALKAGDSIDLEARLTPLHLSDVLPTATGEVQGRVRLFGARSAPDVEADLRASTLAYADWRAAHFSLNGHLPWAQGHGELHIDAAGIDSDANPAGEVQHLRIAADGNLEHLNLSTELRSHIGTFTLHAQSHWQPREWQARINTLHLIPVQGPAWHLQAPLELTRTAIARRPPQWTLNHACLLTSSETGSLCVRADWPKEGLELNVNALPLSLFAPLLAEDALDASALTGEINLNATLRPLLRGWQGDIRLRSLEGGLMTADVPVIGYRNLALDLVMSREQLQARFNAVLPSAENTAVPGQLEATLSTGWDDNAPLSGHLRLDMPTLTWLELFSGDLAAPGGHLSGHLQLSGTRSAPQFGGQAQLTDLTSELPALGLRLHTGELHLSAPADAPARIHGQIHSGEGVLTMDGHLDWYQPGLPLRLHLGGDHVVAANTRDLNLTIAPDLTIETSRQHPISVTGTIGVPAALLELERLHSGQSPSPDVIILDPEDPDDTGERSALRLDVTLALGKDVRLRGFGLDGRLEGNLHVNAEPGHEMTANGRLNVNGGYKAYGQALTITRGQLQFTNSPISDPLVEMTAERKIETEDMTAGLTVNGRASAPEISVWTNPASDNSQALSWLAFGRSMSSLTKFESQQFDTAAAALTAGGNLLAGQIGRRLGLDDAGISSSRTLGENVLGIGKQVSPRLYVGVGVSVIGSGQVVTLKYLLRKGFDVELETSTVESRSSINWRHESD